MSVARPVDVGSEAEDALVGLEVCSTEALELLGRAKDTLSSIGEKMFPEQHAQLSALPSLLELFASVEDPIVEFSRVQTMAGAEAMLTLAMGHGVSADFEKVTGEYPRDAQGNEVACLSFPTMRRGLPGEFFSCWHRMLLGVLPWCHRSNLRQMYFLFCFCKNSAALAFLE